MTAARCQPTYARPLRRAIAGWAVLCPSREPVDHGEQTACMLDVAGGRLACFIHRHGPNSDGRESPETLLASQPPALLVLKLPGTAGRAERSTPLPGVLLPSIRSETWTWNPPGYGRSSGRASLRTLPQATVAFFDSVVARRRGPQTRVWIMGNSLGCVCACHLAAERPVDGMLLRNPPPLVEIIPTVAEQKKPPWLRPIFRQAGRWIAGGVPPSLDALCTAPRCRTPAIFMQSDLDRLVPPALQEKVRAAYGGAWKLIRMEGLEHHEPPGPKHLEELSEELQWLWETAAASG